MTLAEWTCAEAELRPMPRSHRKRDTNQTADNQEGKRSQSEESESQKQAFMLLWTTVGWHEQQRELMQDIRNIRGKILHSTQKSFNKLTFVHYRNALLKGAHIAHNPLYLAMFPVLNKLLEGHRFSLFCPFQCSVRKYPTVAIPPHSARLLTAASHVLAPPSNFCGG